jgi:manganese transport protein
MNLRTRIQNSFNGQHPRLQALELLKYIGPGFLVTVGFIDPGNWASNVAAGSLYGYRLLWTTTVVVSGLNVLLLVDTLRHLVR